MSSMSRRLRSALRWDAVHRASGVKCPLVTSTPRLKSSRVANPSISRTGPGPNFAGLEKCLA
jgi:hypothetical protein